MAPVPSDASVTSTELPGVVFRLGALSGEWTADVRLPPAHGFGSDRTHVYTLVDADEARTASSLFALVAERLAGLREARA